MFWTLSTSVCLQIDVDPRSSHLHDTGVLYIELVGPDVKPGGAEGLCRLHPLYSTSVTVARTGNQSTAAPSVHTTGPAAALTNGLSDTLNIGSLFGGKFGNAWVFSQDYIPVQWRSQRVEAAPPCFGFGCRPYAGTRLQAHQTRRTSVAGLPG